MGSEETQSVFITMQQRFSWVVMELYKYEKFDVCLGYILHCLSSPPIMYGKRRRDVCRSNYSYIYLILFCVKESMPNGYYPVYRKLVVSYGGLNPSPRNNDK